ncbi:synaptonemal complex protein 2-like isoform X3 [Hemibagrus wyckioides]|uniref:synaptonemal complex protein 2-like isoform X3 n=1 Tax=Hemibagrus wyckioides TaxID=337641 RepID=UPI00266DAA23|nr:synaptonemal complex protein 2-like isoform X3 [Hemibagrus wyckioides]
MARHQDKQVEESIDQALKHNFRPLEELQNETRGGVTSKCSRHFISKLDKLINRELDQQNVKNASVVFTIFNKFGNTLVFPEGEGISSMVSQGLVRKLVQWFEKLRKLWVEAGPTRNELLVNLAEDFFDALMVIHESCKEGTFQVTESLLHYIGKLASDPQVNILIQKEAVRKLNMILGMIPLELKKEKKIFSSQEASSVMSDLASRIIKGGDYDLQVALMEALCRMTSRAQRRDLADQLFRMEFVASAFNKIQDSEFETDCRKFLNLVNGMQGDDRSVYSYPCLEVFLDEHVLLMPVDENLHEFWIDFNVGSQSISFYFCLADDQAKQESQWDTLCITENEVHSYTVQEEKDIKVLQLVLTEPMCLSSIEGSRLHIHFSSSLDILKVTKKVYGETKNKKFIRKTTTSVVKTTVQVIMDEGGSQVLFPESQGSSQHVEKNVPYSVRNETRCRSLSSQERDAQHINQQMITPLRSKVSESCMYVSGSAGCKLGRSPFSCVLPESASGKAKVKPALEMVASSVKRKTLELKELLTARLADGVKSVSVERESSVKQVVPDLQSPYIHPGQEGLQVVGKYRRHIPIEKVVEMVQAEQELQEEPLDNSIVLDSQPAVWREKSILPSPSCFYKKRPSVSGSLFPGQREFSHQSRAEPPQQSLSAQSSSEGLSHKQLHAQLTQRLEQVLREREQQEQNPQELLTAGKEAGLVKKAQSPPQTKRAKAEQSGTGNGAGMSNTTKTEKAAKSMVKQINSHYNHTSTAAQERPSWFNSAPTSRYIFNKSWCPNSVAKISAKQSKKASNQNKDIYAFSFNMPEVSEKKNRSSFEISGMERSVLRSSLSLSSTSKMCPPMKPAGHNVKKHLFSDTDTDNMTDISWLTSANRKPKPKVADYTRQPVKPTRHPTTLTFETPNIPIPSPKSAKALPKPKRKRQKVVEEKNKTTKDLASRKPKDRPKRTSVMTRSYRELSESESELETDEQPPAKKFIIKQPEKPQRTDSVLNRPAIVKPPVKKTSHVRSHKVHKLVKEKEEKELSNYEKSKQKKMIATVLGPTKGKEHDLVPKITPICPSALPSNIIKSVEKSTTMPRSAHAPVGPMSKKSQAIIQEGKIGGIIEQAEKEKETPGIATTHPVTSGNFMEENEFSEILGSKWLKKRKNLLSPVSTKESWASKSTSFCFSPFSIEKTRSAEKNASLPRSPLTPLQPLCISPVGAISPPLDLPSHLRGIQASSFYKSSGGQDIVRTLPQPFVTPAAQRQSAQENDELRPEQLFFHPIIASTAKEKCPSMLNSPDQDEDLRGFLNSTSQRVLQTSFDKESVISLVTLSQSSHTSMNNIATICTELEKTPASVQRTSGEKAESGPATSRTRHSSCDSTSLSEQDGSEYDKRIKAGPSKHAVRMKPRKLFKPTVKQQSKKKGSKQPIQVDSSTEEGEKEKGSGTGRGPRRRITEDTEVRSTVVSSCWKGNVEADMDLVQSEVSTSQEMGYVCRQLSSELKRKFENRSRKMDLFTKQSLKTCRQHVSTITMKVQEYRSQRLEAVKQVLMDEIKNLEQDDTTLRNMEAELTTYWKKHTLDFHAYQERGTQRLNNLRSTIETNLCQNTDCEEQIFFSQMHLMKKDMTSVQDHLFRQMHEEEFKSVRKGLQALFLSDVPRFLR